MTKSKRLEIRLTPGTLELARKLAKEQGITVTELITNLITKNGR